MLRRPTRINPLVHSPYVQNSPEKAFAPPSSDFIVDENGTQIDSEDDRNMITE